jgi:hypothetical protein
MLEPTQEYSKKVRLHPEENLNLKKKDKLRSSMKTAQSLSSLNNSKKAERIKNESKN